MTDLTFDPQISLASWTSLVAAAVVLLAWYGRDAARRLGTRQAAYVVLLMIPIVAMPLALLLNPTWHERLPPPEGKPVLKVLVDTSASMATRDGANQATRFSEAAGIVQSLHDELTDRYDIRMQSFAASTAPVDVSTIKDAQLGGQTTNLADALSQTLTGDVPQGQVVVLLSDGVHNADGGEAAVIEAVSRAKAVAASLLVKTFGGDTAVTDLEVDVRSPQELAFVGQQVSVQAELLPRGMSGRAINVALMQEGKEIARQEVTLTDQPRIVEFPIKHTTMGVFRYEVQVAPLEGEVASANNRAAYVLRVVDEPIHVLLIEGKPYWDTKFLVRLLASDPAVELVSVVRLAEGRFLERKLERPSPTEQSSKQPAEEFASSTTSHAEQWKVLNRAESLLADPATLSKFQIVILGRDADSYLTDEALVTLKRWLAQEGGSLVCFRGTPTAQVNQRFSALLPVRTSAARESRFRMKLTEVGKELRWIRASGDDSLERMPSLATRTESTSPQPLAVVLAVAQSPQGETPVVASMPYGIGRVVVFEGAGMWRWAFLAPKYEQHEAVYGGLWQSLIRWLVSNTELLPSQTWALRSDKLRFYLGEAATASLLVRETVLTAGLPTIELVDERDGKVTKIAPVPMGDEPGAYRVLFGKLPEGHYEARIAGAAATDSSAHSMFEVRNNVDEVVKVAANKSLMTKLADISGGAVLQTASPQEVASFVDRHLARLRPEQVSATPAWDRWWVLVGVFAVWAAAWGWRRSHGLI